MTRWNPIRDAIRLRDAIDRLFEESFVRTFPTWDLMGVGTARQLAMDVYTTDEDVIVVASVPGMKPEDVEVTIEGDTLIIRGEVPEEQIDGAECIIAERPRGRFERALRLNVPVDADKAEAVFHNGVLTLTLPKREEVRPKVIEVKHK